MVDYNILKMMMKFTSPALVNEFWELYKFEYGEKKAIKIVRKIESSEKFQQYLENILNKSLIPSPKGLEYLMNSISYFMFSKEETLCLGGLICFIKWRNRWLYDNNIFDAIEKQDFDKQYVHICANFIDHCSKNKYNQSNNFFTRFERRIVNIIQQEESYE